MATRYDTSIRGKRLVYRFCTKCMQWRYSEVIGVADADVAIIRCDGCGQTHLIEEE